MVTSDNDGPFVMWLLITAGVIMCVEIIIIAKFSQ